MITITTNLKAVTEKIVNQYQQLTRADGALRDKLLRTVATTIGGEMKDRIHGKGIASDGSQIGKYNDTKPIYINPNNSPKAFKPEGKPKKTGTFKSGKKKGQDKIEGNKNNKTKYFSSYKAYREHIGRNTDTINLSLWGFMEQDFGIVANEPIRTSLGYGLGFKNSNNATIAEAHQNRFGKIYALTDDEKQMLRNTTEHFIANLDNQ